MSRAAFAAAVFLIAPAAAENSHRAIVPTWIEARRLEVGPQPRYFTYKDRIPQGPGHDAESDRQFAAYRAERAANGWFCDRVVHVTDGLASVVFSDLPTGPSWFDIRCTGNCAGLKYAIAGGAFQYIQMTGAGAPFAHVRFPGPTNYMLKSNLGFAFFLDEPGAPDTVVARQNPAPQLPTGTDVTIVHWRSSLFSSLGGKDCSN
jgi:hypothetical protein